MRAPKLFLCIVALLALIPAASYAVWNGSSDRASDAYEPTSLIIKFKPAVDSKTAGGQTSQAAHAALRTLNERFHVREQEPLVRGGTAGEHGSPFRDVYRLKVDAGTDIEAMARDYRDLPQVEYAEPDYRLELFLNKPPEPEPVFGPNDPLYPKQWHLDGGAGKSHYHVVRVPGDFNDFLTTVGSTADMEWQDRYDNPTDATISVVAIIDTGVDTDHPDLSWRIWTNPLEIAGNGIDDDHNGYVDDTKGWDFSGSDEYVFPITQDNDPSDYFGHGTHCAGIVGARTNNHLGVAGVVNNVRIMPLKMFPGGLTSIAAEAIVYAADNGADVINMSWGSSFNSATLQSALDYASSRGVVLVAAMGNSGAYNEYYPASSEGVISVGATTCNDDVTAFSTYSDYINVCAPGEDILSLRAEGTDMYAEDNEPNVHIIQTDYYVADGTSFAAPCVAGIAAYMRSASPGLIPDSIKTIIENTAVDLWDPYGDGSLYFGWDMYSGHGRVSAYAATAAVPTLKAMLTAPNNFSAVSGQVTVTGTANGAGFAGFTLEYGLGDNPDTWYTISSSATAVNNGTLGTWDVTALEGPAILRLTVGTSQIAYKHVFIANDPVAEITSPEATSDVSGYVWVQGSAMCTDFSYISVDFSDTRSGAWVPIATVTRMVWQDQITTWNASELADGPYDLRVSVYSSQGLEEADTVRVNVLQHTDWSVDLEAMAAWSPNYGDFDDDGQNEIVIATRTGIRFFETDGTPATGMPAIPTDSFLASVAVGNLDGDGIDDLVAISGSGIMYGRCSSAPDFNVSVEAPTYVDGYGVGHMKTYQLVGDERNSPRVHLKDVDNDGLDEIHYYPGVNSDLYYYIFNPDGTPYHPNWLVYGDYYAQHTADLDGDGIDELYMFNRSTATLQARNLSNGDVTASLLIEDGGSSFDAVGMSAVDIDGDTKAELILFGYYRPESNYFLMAFDEDLVMKDGWPHEIPINSYLVPTNPVFGDVDGDGELEYLTCYFDMSTSFIYAWNLDGSPLLDVPGTPAGYFTEPQGMGAYTNVLLADVSGDGSMDVVAGCIQHPLDLGGTYPVERVEAYDNTGASLAGFPWVTTPSMAGYQLVGPIPVVGDIDRDGVTDILYASASYHLLFSTCTGAQFNPQYAPCPMWRYNRELNATYMPELGGQGSPTAGNPTAETGLPTGFELEQNYPNPFNPNTQISFTLSSPSTVRLDIFNITGQRVRTLVDDRLEAGRHVVEWDGRSSDGRQVASGIYLYRMKAGDFVDAKKMTLLK